VDILISLLACLALGAPIGLAGSVLIGRGPELMAGLFHTPTGLGWPHGVQEEDPPGGWMWRIPTQESSLAASEQRTLPTRGAASDALDASSTVNRTALPEILDDDGGGTGRAEPRLEPLSPHVHAGTNRARSGW
jgi:hypothetical protein